MIYIDFQGGAHGNYLEFVCNTILFNIKADESPFNKNGAAHSKQYKEPKKVQCGHFFSKSNPILNSTILSIRIESDDLLPLTMVSLVRAGDHNISNINHNTYNKFNNDNYRSLLDNLINNYEYTDLETYNVIKDKSWPNITSIEEFNNLPEDIKYECINLHNYYPFELSLSSPDCPAFVLRDFFKRGFYEPKHSGFLTEQQKMVYDPSNTVHHFPFNAFYDISNFVTEIYKLAAILGIEFLNVQKLVKLHKEFLNKQLYKNSKIKCDEILINLYNKQILELEGLDIIEQAYIDANIEKHFNITLPFTNSKWFNNSGEIYKLLNLK